jgi:prepilin-type N-terminal cleavage/methylation domain-containing protein
VNGMLPGNKRGLTLIELMISAALLTLIMGAAMSLFFFGTRSFTQGDSQARIQRNIRLALDYLPDEIRNTTELIVLPASLPVPAGYTRGLTLNGTQLEFIHYRDLGGGSMGIDKKAPVVELITYAEVYASDVSGGSILTCIVRAQDGSGQFEMKRDILLNNLKSDELQSKVSFDAANGNRLQNEILYYKKP